LYEAPHGITLKRFIPNWKTHLQMWNYYTVYEVYRQVETWKLYERAACRMQNFQINIFLNESDELECMIAKQIMMHS
jgi:hypothetical protein